MRKQKKEGYTDQLNQELLGTLGEKASSEQISAAYEKREVHRDTTYHKTNTKHASPWKDTAPAENTLKTRKRNIGVPETDTFCYCRLALR